MGTIALIVFHVQHLHGKLQGPDRSPFLIYSSPRQHVPISGCKSSDAAKMARPTSGPAVRWKSTLHGGEYQRHALSLQATQALPLGFINLDTYRPQVHVKLRYTCQASWILQACSSGQLSTPDDRLQLKMAMTRTATIVEGETFRDQRA